MKIAHLLVWPDLINEKLSSNGVIINNFFKLQISYKLGRGKPT